MIVDGDDHAGCQAMSQTCCSRRLPPAAIETPNPRRVENPMANNSSQWTGSISQPKYNRFATLIMQNTQHICTFPLRPPFLGGEFETVSIGNGARLCHGDVATCSPPSTCPPELRPSDAKGGESSRRSAGRRRTSIVTVSDPNGCSQELGEPGVWHTSGARLCHGIVAARDRPLAVSSLRCGRK